MPNKDIEALPHKERPHCPYEKEEYDRVHAALSGSPEATATASPNADAEQPETETPGEILLHQNIATFHVMLTRAQAALGWHTYTEETRADGEKYTMRSSKVSALLQATQSIARELRQWLRLLANDAVRLALNLTKTEPDPPESIGLAALLEPILEKSEGVLEEAIEEQRRLDADKRRLKRGEMTQEAFDAEWPEDEFDRDDCDRAEFVDDDLGPSPGAPLSAPMPEFGPELGPAPA